jgi:hypothetical protein
MCAPGIEDLLTASMNRAQHSHLGTRTQRQLRKPLEINRPAIGVFRWANTNARLFRNRSYAGERFSAHLGVFLLWNATNVHFCTFLPERFLAFPLDRQGQLHEGRAMHHRNPPKLDADHNAEIRAEIGDRLRILLSREQPRRPTPRVQHLLDRLSVLDDR